MAFMQKQITVETRWLCVETTQGIEYVSVFDNGLNWADSDAMSEDAREDAIAQLQDYTEGEPESWENVKGYGARLSAPGYLDCTPWAVFDTYDEAKEYLDDEEMVDYLPGN
jgi:hypothetical protein